MCCKRPSAPPVPPPPPLPPPPPVPPPPPSISGLTHGARTVVSHKSKTKTKAKEKHHVSFAPDPARSADSNAAVSQMSKAPPPPPPPPPPPALPLVPQSTPHRVSGEVVHQQLPTFEARPNPNGGPGYIRIQGGVQTSRWHTYDAHVPTADFLAGDARQQANLVDAMYMSQLGSAAPLNDTSRQVRARDTSSRQNLHSSRSTASAARQNPSAALTAANLQQITSKAPTPTAAAAAPDALTSVSRRLTAPLPSPAPPSTHTHHTTTTTNEAPSSNKSCAHHHHHHHHNNKHKVPQQKQTSKDDSKRLKCFNCGTPKNPEEDNVKEICGKVPICWQCLCLVDAGNAVRKWVGSCS